MKLKPTYFALHLFFAAAAGSAAAGTIACVPAHNSAGPAPWIRRISIDEHSRTVNMDIVRQRTKDTDTMGKMRAELLSMDETQGSEPVYVFNAIPAAGDEVTNLFKLFKAGEWRLISAGVTFVGKVPVLRAVDPGTVFNCKRSDMG
ncbi:hypothetical protein J2W35_003327 [Variovorax boronicumulans]|uniref:hypothetical protein n=1 Tax=Variovorax boronicumulans TaxID=436515 RepID=UPI00277DFF3B|nr:hypothetical protein [Variovorax boronicumulans]MDQ0082968.1 hypothetical protein [Variovorax boronicumulans]